MAQIVGIGANVKDTLFQLEKYPSQDTKQCAKTVKEAGGGPCGTGLVAAAKLGATCAYIGNCSDDSVGAFLREDFEKYGVGTQLMRSIPNTIGFAPASGLQMTKLHAPACSTGEQYLLPIWMKK